MKCTLEHPIYDITHYKFPDYNKERIKEEVFSLTERKIELEHLNFQSIRSTSFPENASDPLTFI